MNHHPSSSADQTPPSFINPFHAQPPAPAPTGSSSTTPSSHQHNPGMFEGAQTMGVPAVPTSHPNNQKAAMWGASPTEQPQYQQHHQPYVQYAPLPKQHATVDSVVHKFNIFTKKAEHTANNIWRNLKTGPSVTEAAWAKVNVTARAITGGGFETLYKQTFETFPNEKLLKSFACYLSTTTGPVAGTLYLSNVHVAFASDRPLSFTAQSGLESWSYYKVMIPLGKIGTINPVILKESSTERYIHLVTIDSQDFWFMGFVNYEKASHYLLESVSSFAASGIPVRPSASHNSPSYAPAGIPGQHAAAYNSPHMGQ